MSRTQTPEKHTSAVSWNVASKDSTARMPMRTTNASPLPILCCSFLPPILSAANPESLHGGRRALCTPREQECAHDCGCWVTTLVGANEPQHTVAIAWRNFYNPTNAQTYAKLSLQCFKPRSLKRKNNQRFDLQTASSIALFNKARDGIFLKQSLHRDSEKLSSGFVVPLMDKAQNICHDTK